MDKRNLSAKYKWVPYEVAKDMESKGEVVREVRVFKKRLKHWQVMNGMKPKLGIKLYGFDKK